MFEVALHDKARTKLLPIIWALLFVLSWPSFVAAQEAVPGWSSPRVIFQTEGKVASTPMSLIPDPMGRVHLLFPHKPNDTTAVGLDYMVWDGAEWSEAINVLLNPDGSPAQIVRGIIDESNQIHVVWIGGLNRLYYSSASADQARSARWWLAPIAIAESLGTEAGIAVSPEGSVFVAYADANQAGAISLIELSPTRDRWVDKGIVVSTQSDAYPGEVGLVIDDRGRMHLTWTTLQRPDGWPPTAAHYARSLDMGMTWGTRVIADGDYGQAGVAVPRSDEVHIFWSSTAGGDGTYHQWSVDGGQTWSSVQQFPEFKGFSGLPSFGVDSMGKLHYLRGSSVYMMWDGAALSSPQLLTTSTVCLQGGTSCGERGQLAISTGNRLHVVFETDFNQLWYTSRLLDTPAIPTPTIAPPSAEPVKQEEKGSSRLMASDDTSGAVFEEKSQRDALSSDLPTDSGSQANVLIFSILPSVLLILAAIMFALRRKASRR